MGCNSYAQLKFYDNNRLTIGNTTPYSFYYYTFVTTGMYMKCATNNFFQIDVSAAATRLASHGNQVVFYNTQTSTFNDLQVRKVYNYSDALAKTNIKPLNTGCDIISKLKPVTYNFKNDISTNANQEIGLLAQDVEKVLPNLVFTDNEGKKLVDYISLIPILIKAIDEQQKEINELKSRL